MQKTFDVWVKKKLLGFNVCSKKVMDGEGGFVKVRSNHMLIDDGTQIRACDVSQWLEELGLNEDEVIEGQITFKFKNKIQNSKDYTRPRNGRTI